MKFAYYLNILIRSIPKIFSSKKVNFLICGTQKGGTTALYSYLSKHPEISMAIRKEIHFFDKEFYFIKNRSFYPVYHYFFDFKEKKKNFGEATPAYMYVIDAPARIYKYNPDMKFIILLRNPLDRAHSHWNMNRIHNYEKLDFSDAIANENSVKKNNSNKQDLRYSYIDRGFYTDQLKRIWNYFPKEQTLILKNEELKEKPQKTLDKVTQFLGVETMNSVVNKEIHSLDYDSEMSDEDRNFLLSVYRDDIKCLEKMLGWDCSSWLGN